MAIASNKKKKLTDQVYQTIRTDIPLRRKIADALDVEVRSVYDYATRKAPSLSKKGILDIIAKHLGKTKEEILEPLNT